MTHNDNRIFVTNNRSKFLAAAQGYQSGSPLLTILQRDGQEKEDLIKRYKKLKQLSTLNPSLDLKTIAGFNGDRLKVTIPPELIEIGLEADLLKTAQLYADATGIKSKFILRPSTVVDADNHTHDASVLSISWGGAGLAVDKNIDGQLKETAQLEEGDFGLLSPRMPHRSPYRSAPGRMVMFVAPPLHG